MWINDIPRKDIETLKSMVRFTSGSFAELSEEISKVLSDETLLRLNIPLDLKEDLRKHLGSKLFLDNFFEQFPQEFPEDEPRTLPRGRPEEVRAALNTPQHHWDEVERRKEERNQSAG